RLGMRVRRDRGGDGLVRKVDLGREAIELDVAEQAPPVAARKVVGGRGRQPDRVPGPRRFLAGGRHRRARPLVVGADRARRERAREQRRQQPLHGAASTKATAVAPGDTRADLRRRSLSSTTYTTGVVSSVIT